MYDIMGNGSATARRKEGTVPKSERHAGGIMKIRKDGYDMSGSREKQLRKLEREQNPEAYKKKNANQGLSKGKKIAITVISCVICLLLIGGIATAVFLQSGGFTRMVTAVKVGDYSLSAADYNYYYYGSFNRFVNQYGQSLSTFGLDTSKPLKDQTCALLESGTWEDYFRQAAEDSIRTIYALADTATKEGYQLTEDDKSYIEMNLKSIEDSATAQKVTAEQIVEDYYGPGVNMEVFRAQMDRETLAESYKQYLVENYNFSDDELDASYISNKASIDQVTYRSLLITTESKYPESVTSSTATDEQKNAAKEAAKAAADEMLDKIAEDGSNFNELCIEYAPQESKSDYQNNADYSLTRDQNKSKVTDSTLSTWLFDNTRAAGNKTVLESTSGYRVVYLVNKGRNTTNVVNVRHILLVPSTTVDQSTGLTTEQTVEVGEAASALLNTWRSGEATEASFAQLAKENSTDSGSAYMGGLYKGVYPGQMVTSFNDWCFDSARKPGDTDIVYSSYGAHIMYFVSTGDPYWKVQARSYLANDKYASYIESLLGSYTLTQDGFGFGYTATTL